MLRITVLRIHLCTCKEISLLFCTVFFFFLRWATWFYLNNVWTNVMTLQILYAHRHSHACVFDCICTTRHISVAFIDWYDFHGPDVHLECCRSLMPVFTPMMWEVKKKKNQLYNHIFLSNTAPYWFQNTNTKRWSKHSHWTHGRFVHFFQVLMGWGFFFSSFPSLLWFPLREILVFL